jgi:hypothetical protein
MQKHQQRRQQHQRSVGSFSHFQDIGNGRGSPIAGWGVDGGDYDDCDDDADDTDSPHMPMPMSISDLEFGRGLEQPSLPLSEPSLIAVAPPKDRALLAAAVRTTSTAPLPLSPPPSAKGARTMDRNRDHDRDCDRDRELSLRPAAQESMLVSSSSSSSPIVGQIRTAADAVERYEQNATHIRRRVLTCTRK